MSARTPRTHRNGQAQGASTRSRGKQIVASAFDWDDNIAVMPNRVLIFHVRTGKTKEVPLQAWAAVRTKLGTPGPWQDYEVREDESYGRSHEDKTGRHLYFAEDLLAARQTDGWQGPQLPRLVASTRTMESAQNVAIITARGNAIHDLREGLSGLKRDRIIANVPAERHLYPIRNALLPYGDIPTEEAKVDVMRSLLDEIERTPLPRHAQSVVARTGSGRERLHLWSFSDDDPENIRRALEGLGAGVKAGRWPHIKISLQYSGREPLELPRELVIQPDGQARAASPLELREEYWLRSLEERRLSWQGSQAKTHQARKP